MDYFCKECLTLDPLGIGGHHVRCKPASNTASNKEHSASNRKDDSGRVLGNGEDHRKGIAGSGLRGVQRGAVAAPVEDSAPTRKQRWDRESYNAYQREYMRKKRASHPLDGMAVLVDKTD